MVLLGLLLLLAPVALPREHAIYRSVDRGVTWTKASAGLPVDSRINAFGATANRIFAGTDTGIYFSDDHGRSWRKTSVTLRTVSFAVSGSTMYAGTDNNGLLASSDQGLSWTKISGLASRNIRSLVATQGRVYAGTDADGVWVSGDQGRTWAAQNSGLPAFSQVFAMAVADDVIFAGLYARGLYAWSAGNRKWSKAGNVKPLVAATTAGTLAVGHNPGGIYWSDQPASERWTKGAGDFDSAAPVWAMAAGEKLVVAGVAARIFRSEDNGRTWSRTAQGLPENSAGVSFLVQGNTVLAGLVINR